MDQFYNLTTPQQNIWNLQSYYSDTSIANICGAVFYREKREEEHLKKAINVLIENQSALRLRFVMKDGKARQYVKGYEHIDLPTRRFQEEDEFEQYAQKVAATPIGLLDRDMFRIEIVYVGEQQGIFAVLSHLISDAWTFSLIVNEVDQIYYDLHDAVLPKSSNANYLKFIEEENAYFQSKRFQKDKDFWNGKYHEKPESSTIRYEKIKNKSIAAKRFERKLSDDLSNKIVSVCRTKNISEAVLFEAALMCYLYKINGDNQTVTIGIPVLNRTKGWEKETAGMFISTIPMTISVTDNLLIHQLCQNITMAHYDVFRHQKYPYSEILNNLREKQNFEGNLYDVMFSFQNARTNTDSITKWYSNGYSEVPFAFHVDNRDDSDAYTLTVDYHVELFREEKEVKDILERLEYVIEQMIENDNITIKDISVVPEKEKQRILYDFNNTKVDYPKDKCVHELFMEQAKKTPDDVAVVFGEKEITYRELDEMSNALAYLLREKGVERGDIVPIIAKRSWYILAAMLGILKAGAGYMPVAPDYPKDRIQFIINEAKSKIGCVLGYEEKLEGIELLKLDELDLEHAWAEKRLPVENRNEATDVCYVIFTSGSTGVPKGVMIRHSNVANYSHNNNNNNVCNAVIQEGYRKIISVTNIVFDIFVTESILPLLNGMTVYLTSDEEVFSQSAVNRIITENQIEVLQTTPTKMKGYLFDNTQKEYLSTLKVIILGGEALTEGLYEELKSQTTAEIFNIYGPAETTVWSSNARVEDDDITIGRPIANTQIYILDRHGNLVPIGVPGELCIAGDGVGLGYLNRPDLTAERFVDNLFATEENGHGKTMYHTGDLAAWRENGEIEYLGRIDTQVKIRGMRIELGEIESVMSQFPGIRMCAVTDKKDEEGRQYLVGYYTTVSDEKEKQDIMTAVKIDEKELRSYLSTKLPKYMVPNYFMHLSKLPMTPSGKTDRKNLPVPDMNNLSEEELTLPQNDAEEKILVIWKEELHTEKLGCNQDFFEVGGDSLLAIALLTRLEKEFGVRLQVKDIFDNRTVTRQAVRISEQSGIRESMIIAKRDRFPLTPQQRAVYLASQKEPDSLLYNMPAFILLPDEADRDRLIEAIQKVFENFQILRMKVSQETDGLFGVLDHTCELCIEQYSEEKETFVRPFDLMKAPLFRVGLSDKHLMIDMHHIISDGTSLLILIKAVQKAYEGKTFEKELAGYGDYAEYLANYLKSEKIEQSLQWYRENLVSVSEPVTFPKVRIHSEYEGENVLYRLSKELRTKEKETCSRYRITETMLHMAAYALLLKEYSGLENISGSIVVTNRQHAETENTMGMFVNTLPIAWSFENRQTVEDYLSLCKEKLLKLYEYQEIPFEIIIENVENVDALFFNTSFVYQANAVASLEMENHTLVPEYADTHTAKFDLTVEVTPDDKGSFLRLEYRTAKIDRALAKRMAESYECILHQLTEKKYVDEISALTEGEKEKVLYDFNNTKVDYPKDKCVHELFMEQAQKTPDAIAVVFEEKEITYRELDEMSNVLAHFLLEQGCETNGIIPIISTRSYYILVAMLGVLKAGGAYLLLSPDYPLKRIEYMVEEASCKFALVGGYWEQQLNLQQFDIHVILSQNRNARKISKRGDLACVIHTSGTTGNPKLSMIGHQNMMNYIYNTKPLIEKIHCSISYTLVAFDAFHLDGFIPLLLGKKVVIASEKQIYEQNSFEQLIDRNNQCMIFSTPTKWMNYIRNTDNMVVFTKIKMIVTGGEVFEGDLYRRIIQANVKADIYNMYGPTETCINSTYKRVMNNDDITIGRPIANTQIYILDRQGSPVPIGVPGELCIAGDGVGLGYLNRPDLTAERFVDNPFATEENGHGKIMYHTGDLAAWRENGEIEYLGRIDTQVKIRGLRIELGEIESVMSQFPGIRMCAVTDKKDEEGRQYLVGYYTTVSDEKENQDIMTAVKINEKELRNHLSSKLPKYMVPNYFMHLKKLPMTPSGKTDRKNLPVPTVKGKDLCEYVEPVTEQEKKLCAIMEEILNYSPIGTSHDFFSCGGDSLRAMEFVTRAEGEGLKIRLQDIFNHPTVSKLLGGLQEDRQEEFLEEGYCVERFAKYESILDKNKIADHYELQEAPIRSVLLSGITGFLGAHIADALLQDENCVIYCLVRSKQPDDRRGKFPQILNYYFGEKYSDFIGTRIIPIVGDITREKLSDELPEKVDMVIHAAATVKHYGSYEYFYKVNTLGTKHMADYALRTGARFIHISTISVSGNSLADSFDTEVASEERCFGEDCLYQGQSLSNVYVRSKFEAECVVLDAMLQGLQANIIRVGNLTNRSSDYVFQPNYKENAFLSRIKAATELGCLPDYMMPLYSEFSPVDDTADAIVRIAKHFSKEHTIFHVYSNQNLYFDRLFEILKELSIEMQVVNGETFARRLKETVSQNKAYIYEAFMNDMDQEGRLNYETNIHIKNDFTLSYLKQLGFTWTKIDFKYVKGYIDYFTKLGYLGVDAHED